MELSRNRLFYEQMGKGEQLKTDDSSLKELQRLHSTKTSLKRRLSLLMQSPDSNPNDIFAVKEQIQEAQGEWDKLKEDMRDRQKLGLFFPFNLSPADFQELLKSDQMIVAYFISRSKLFRFQLTKSKLTLFTADLPKTFSRDLKQLLSLLKNGLIIKNDKVLSLNDKLSKLIGSLRIRSSHVQAHCEG